MLQRNRPYPCFIVPPYMLRAILEHGAPSMKEHAWATLTFSEQVRGERQAAGSTAALAAKPGGAVRRRTVFDARHGYDLPGRKVRSEGSRRSHDRAVNEAYDGCGATWDFFKLILNRNSIDGRGMKLDSSVHYGQLYDNAFWNGRQMVYGDGDGEIFRGFTSSLDVIAHELSHGVTQYEADLTYRGESGALNESLSDVFGVQVKQFVLGQSAAEADWLIGSELFMPGVKARGIRSMRNPGTAYDDPVLGKDPQPAHMKDFVRTKEDNGGVHINSGIPNRAFCEAALRLGGNSWDKAGPVWYRALTDRLGPASRFRDAVTATVTVAGELFGRNSLEQKAVRSAWGEVGL